MIAEAMQTNDETGELEYILSADDLCNLRLVDKKTNGYVQRAFAVRFFENRKHMFSEYSLNALIEIARHPTFSNYVRKIALGPERISQFSDPELADITYEKPELLGIWHLWYHNRVGGSGNSFYSERGTRLLKRALENLTKLQVFSIESYPEANTNRGHNNLWSNWRRPFGANTLVRELESMIKLDSVAAQGWLCAVDADNVNWHLQPILKSLEAIKDRPEWKIDFYLNSSEKYIQATEPFNIDSPLWQACKDRVRHIYIHRTIQTLAQPHNRADWLTKLFKSCGRYVDELNCQNTFYWSKIVCNAPFPTLRRLNIYHAPVQDMYFNIFLERHAESLESINLNRVTLSMDEYSRHADEEHTSGVLQSDKYEREDASWIAKFELMLKLVRLCSIDLEYLTWSQSICRGSLLFSNKKGPQVLGSHEYAKWDTTATAKGDDIKTLLNRTIRDNRICFAGYDEPRHLPKWSVVFLK